MIEKLNGAPEAYADIRGTQEYPEIHGRITFYDVFGGTVLMAELYGLPDEDSEKTGHFFGFHIHEGGECTGDTSDLLKNTGGHYNPEGKEHPEHAGDLPPLLSTRGAAWMAVYTGRIHPEEVIGKTVVIHLQPDDFHSQPAGDSGVKIACGVIREWTGQPETGEEEE